MKMHQGMVVPDFIVSPVEFPDGSIKLALRKSFDFRSRSFLRFCMTERDLSSPAFREFCERTTMVMNIVEDASKAERWSASRFTPQQYMDLVWRCKSLTYRQQFQDQAHISEPMSKKILMVQYGKAKWPTGGGRAASAAGKLFFAETDIMKELYAKYLKVNADLLDAREKVARASILFGAPARFGVPPRLMVLRDKEAGGVAFVSHRYAQQEGIREGDKLWPIKASAMITDMAMDNIDMILPSDAVKFKEHLDKPEVMAELMGLLPDLTAKMRSSVPKKRLPKLGFDTLQFMFPNVMDVYRESPAVQRRLVEARSVVEGTAPVETILKLASYRDRQGNEKYQQEFQFLLNGQPKEDTRVRKAILKVAGTAALRAINFTVRGRYGVAMPLRETVRVRGPEGVATPPPDRALQTMICPPWMMPMKANASFAIDDVVAADSAWLIGCLGKDYDGDLLITLNLGHLTRKMGDVWFPDWSKPEDQAWAMSHMALPEKRKDKDPRTPDQVMVDGLKAYGLIGIATNACMVILDAMRVQGRDRKEIMGWYLKLMSVEVQPFVDGLKYVPGGLKRPVLVDKIGKSGAVLQKGLAGKYGVDSGVAERLVPFFRAVRGMDFVEMHKLQEDPTLEGSFYYALWKIFRDWAPFPEVDMQKLGAEVAKDHPLPRTLEIKRCGTFSRFKQDTDARIKFLEPDLSSEELKLALIARCWERRETRFVLALEKWAGFRLIDLVKAAR